MITPQLYTDYCNNKCVEAWNQISLLDYKKLNRDEQVIVDNIIAEALHRIDFNVRMVFDVFDKYGFQHQDLGGQNDTGKRYLLKNGTQTPLNFYADNNGQPFVPVFFAAFMNYFQVIDFRGEFEAFPVDIMLDALYILSVNTIQDIPERIFELRHKNYYVECLNFSPDQFLKENTSGDLGPCVLLSENILIDNYVLNYSDDFEFTFIEYLRFCFEWACLPNLYWADTVERMPYEPILDEVDNNLKPF